MKYFQEIALILIFGINLGRTIPTPGINFKKQLEIEFHPTPLKSLELIFERWTRFGKLGIKHKIEKRDVSSIIDLNDGLSNENENVQVLPIRTEPVDAIPQSAENIIIVSTAKPLDNTAKPVTDFSENSEIIPVVEPSNEVTPPVKPYLTISGEPHVVVKIPIGSTTITPATTLSPVPANPILAPTSSGLYTNILQSLNNLPTRGINGQNINILPSNLENQNFITRGSRFAMYFGTMLLKMLSEYLYGGRGALTNFPGQVVAPP